MAIGKPYRFDGLEIYGDIPEPVRLLQEVDQAVEQTMKMLKPVAVSAYQRHAPGRVAAAIVGQLRDTDGWRLVIKVRSIGMATPIAYWTDQGTGIYRPGGKPIRRRPGAGKQRGKRGRYTSTEGPRPPFNIRGRMVPEFDGQRAQNWVPDARREADARAAVIVQQHMPEQVTDQVSRWLG